MPKNLFVVAAAVLVATLALANPAHAKPRVVATKIDLQKSFGQRSAATDSGYVAIESINFSQRQPDIAGEKKHIPPEFEETLLGWYQYLPGWHVYHVVLKNSDIRLFVYDAVALGFERAGYKVVDVEELPISGNTVNVDVDALWVWVTRETSSGNKQFHFQLETDIISNSPEFAGIGTVKGYGLRNGKKATKAKSYNNTILHAMESYLDNFAEQLAISVEFHEFGAGSGEDESATEAVVAD